MQFLIVSTIRPNHQRTVYLRKMCRLQLKNRQKFTYDDVIERKHFPLCWPFVRGIHRSPVNSPHKRSVTRSFNVSLISALNKRLSKQVWGWWFEAPSRPLWRHCNVFSYEFIDHGHHFVCIFISNLNKNNCSPRSNINIACMFVPSGSISMQLYNYQSSITKYESLSRYNAEIVIVSGNSDLRVNRCTIGNTK